MSDKKKRSMAGLPWIAAMAFFMQALDATILNTALPAIAHSLNRSPLAMQSAIISYTLTVATETGSPPYRVGRPAGWAESFSRIFRPPERVSQPEEVCMAQAGWASVTRTTTVPG